MRTSEQQVTSLERCMLACLKGLWFLAIPALVATLAVRDFVPIKLYRYTGVAWAGLFIALVAVARYWFGIAFGPSPKPATRRGTFAQLVPGIALIAVAALCAFVLRSRFLLSYELLSFSMMPSLQRGDSILASRASQGEIPKRGDVIVIEGREHSREDVVKRVVGLPGDRVTMRGGFAIINGWPVPACDAGRYFYKSGDTELDGRIFVEFLGAGTYLTLHVPGAKPFAFYDVQPDEVFVLGDNRNLSKDSRNWHDGQPSGVPLKDIRARVTRLLTTAQSERIDASHFLAEIGTSVRSAGVDLSEVQAGIQRCLANRPTNTIPPTRVSSELMSRGETP